MIPDIFPWQTQQWEQLVTSRQENRLPHALLFMGDPGLGKRHFALTLAHMLLCNKSDVPCGQCHACHLIRVQSHPDLMLIEPEKAGHMIKIDQVRETVQFVNETALQGGGLRMIIINPANAMNIYAANALLKTLEEPAPNILIILISELNLRLPATIASRCQKIIFQKPTQKLALNWLQEQSVADPHVREDDVLRLLLNLANGAPLKAKDLAMEGMLAVRQMLYQRLDLLAHRQFDPLQLAIELQEHDMQIVLSLLLLWLQDLLRFKLTKGQAELINFDYQNIFTRLAQIVTYQKILDYYDHVRKIYAHLTSGLNLNRQLMLEELFIGWMQYAAR